MKYITQRDKFSCGPIAVINALKWQGFCITEKALPAVREMLDCIRVHGTDVPQFAHFCESYRWPMERPTLTKVNSILRDGDAVVVNTRNRDDRGRIGKEGHYYLITKRTPRSFYCVNYGKPAWRTHRWLRQWAFLKPIVWRVPKRQLFGRVLISQPTT